MYRLTALFLLFSLLVAPLRADYESRRSELLTRLKKSLKRDACFNKLREGINEYCEERNKALKDLLEILKESNLDQQKQSEKWKNRVREIRGKAEGLLAGRFDNARKKSKRATNFRNSVLKQESVGSGAKNDVLVWI